LEEANPSVSRGLGFSRRRSLPEGNVLKNDLPSPKGGIKGGLLFSCSGGGMRGSVRGGKKVSFFEEKSTLT